VSMDPRTRAPDQGQGTGPRASKRKRSWLSALGILTVVTVASQIALVTAAAAFARARNKGWTTYTPDNSGVQGGRVSALAFDTEGQLWVGSESALSLLTTNGQWMQYTPTNSGLPTGDVTAIAVDDMGEVFVGTTGGLGVLDGGWRVYRFPVYDLVLSEGGEAWIGGENGVRVLFPDGHSVEYAFSDMGPQTEYPDISHLVVSLAIEDSGRIWVGTDYGVLRDLGPEGTWGLHMLPILQGQSVSALAVDEADRVWVGTSRSGLNVLSPDEAWTQYWDGNSGIAGNSVRAIAIDRGSRIWVGTASGVSVLAPDGSWTSYTSNNSGLASQLVLDIAIDATNRVWVGTSLGLSAFDEHDASDPQTILALGQAVAALGALRCFGLAGIVLSAVVHFARQRRERARRRRPVLVPVPVPAPAQEALPTQVAIEEGPVHGQATAPAAPAPSEAEAALTRGEGLLREGKRSEAVTALLAAFRTGSPEERQRALEALKALGEIEEF